MSKHLLEKISEVISNLDKSDKKFSIKIFEMINLFVDESPEEEVRSILKAILITQVSKELIIPLINIDEILNNE